MKQLKNVSLNFNLREPKAKRPTQLYAVVRADGKQYKIPLQCKIEPWLWNARRQQPVLISGNENILRIINIVSRLKVGFTKKVCYGCSKNIISEVKQEINEMANEQNLRHSVTRTPKATTLLKRAFDLYYSEKTTKPSTVDETEKRLKCYFQYCRTIGQDKMSMLSQQGLNRFRDYLVKQRNEREAQGYKIRSCNATINYKCELIARLINYMVGHTSFERYHLQPVKYSQLQEFRAKNEDKKRRPLTEDELKAVAECVGLTPCEREYRELFLLQCHCGCRTSDLWRLFDRAQQEHHKHKGQEAFIINTLKKEIRAVIMLTPQVRYMQSKYDNGCFKHLKIRRMKKESFEKNYNRAIKSIFRKAKLDKIEHYVDAHGVAHDEPLHEVIASHFGRYTFIKDCFMRGLNAEEIKDLTGHASADMINEVYLIITSKDKANNVFKALERISEKSHKSDDAVNEQQQPQQSTAQAEILHLRNILAFFGCEYEKYMNINNAYELVRLITTEYEVPLTGMGWSVQKLESLYKAHDMEGYKHLRADIEKLRPNSLNQ